MRFSAIAAVLPRTTRSRVFASVLLVCLAALSIGAVFSAGTGPDQTNTAVAVGLQVARSAACAANLKDGSVLITGGHGANGTLGSAEVFSAKGGSKAVGPMANPRENHACAALADGRVVVAGGTTLGGGTTNSAEIFDPATGAWKPAGPMTVPRSGAAAVGISNGRVLIAGGESNGVATATLEIFNPATNSFAAVAAHLSSPRMRHASVALKDGRVLIAGGSDGKNALDSIDVFDPATGAVSGLGKRLSIPRDGLSATQLLDGRIFFAGGSDGKQESASAEIYNPKTGALAPAASMSVPRAGHVAIRVPNNNSVMIAGGNARGGLVLATELYIPWWNSYKLFGGPPGQQAKAKESPNAAGAADVAGVCDVGSALPTLFTDQADYKPGQTATISGCGWAARSTVSLVLVRDLDWDGGYGADTDD